MTNRNLFFPGVQWYKRSLSWRMPRGLRIQGFKDLTPTGNDVIPLLLYITRNDEYEARMEEMELQLKEVIPKLCDYYGNSSYWQIMPVILCLTVNIQFF